MKIVQALSGGMDSTTVLGRLLADGHDVLPCNTHKTSWNVNLVQLGIPVGLRHTRFRPHNQDGYNIEINKNGPGYYFVNNYMHDHK